MPNSINTTNNLTSTSIPELYVRYFNPKIQINTTITIPYYVTDSTQTEFLNNVNTKTFTTIVKIGNNTFSQTTNAGEQSINIGSISNTGETYFSIYTIDENGVSSVEQFFDILLIDSSYAITSSQTYTMQTSDLSTYSITTGESVSNSIAKANNTGLNNLFTAVKNNGYRKIVMLNEVYMLDYHGNKIMPPDEFTIDMNQATFKVTQCVDLNIGNLIDLRDCFDTHVINGNLIGNYDGFDFATTQSTTGYYIPGEGLAVAEMNGAKYSSFENMDMSYSVGYNLGVFGGKNTGYVGTAGSLKFSNSYYIDSSGNTVNSSILSTTDLIDITGILDRGELQCSVYLNYGGLKLNRAELFIHFYNSSQNYITTIKTRQYQVVKIPSGSSYVRVTGFTSSSTDNSGLSICHTGHSKNCELINIKSHNTRTCAMHPGIYNHLLIKDCTFNLVADENEYKVTKLALDFEDGYENGRNLFFINNEVYEGTSALTIQRCFNANIIGCRNFGLDTRGHIKGAYIKNNFFNNGDIYTTNFDSQSHLKLINNTFLKPLNFLKWDDTGNYDSIGLTELDCKKGYTNNKNCTLFIRNESSSGGDSGGGTNTPTSYTVTNNLTNCTTNNSDTSVSNGSSYSATLSPNSGYVMSSIVVTMGGNDISSTVVSGNNISISNITGNIVITAVASEQAEVLPEITLFDNGLTENYTISNGSNYTVDNLITLSHSSNTYFGFDQSVTFNAGDSINFIIDSCSHDASAYITRVCYLDDNNTLQGYETAVTDDIISAGLPYTLTHTFNNKTTIRPALMKYFGNITISKVYVSRAGSSNETKHYLVTNNLANCTNSNKSTTIQNNSSYSATISPNEGYSITSITVTMGGIDITNTVVDGNTITIGNVTGDIVITVKTALLSTDGHIVTYNLTNCTSLNDQVDVTSGESYYTTITANDGYILTGIIVTMNGIDITTDVVDENNNIHITKVTGDIVITATVREEGVTTNTYRVTYNLDNCTSSNTNSTVEENASYSTTVTANNNYTLGNIIVTMDGVDITSTAVSNNNINISSVTGNIVITATATATSSGGSGSGGTNYTITYNLTHCTTDSTQTSVSSGDYYHTNVIADTGYTISNITVTMGGIDISNSCILNNAVDISNVTGNIVITATAIANSSTGDSNGGSGGSSGGTPTYTVTYNLSNCYTDSTQKTVNQGDYYYTNVIANNGYTLSSVTVAMGGVDVTSLYVDSNNVVNITNVTGDIIITATATVSSSSGGSGSTSTYYNVTYNLTYCSSSSSVSSVASGSSYYTYISPNTNYTLDNISVTMGGVNITSSAVSGNNIDISNVTGNIVITATASYTQNVAYYSVTYNLTRCSSSSSISSVSSGNSYYTNITANTNCTMSNITVTMDGTDITSTAVSDNNINISSVTGNIVITATATANVSQTYTSPTVSFDYGKAIVTQNGYTETFDLAYTQNTGYSGYSSSKTVTDSGGYTYYLTLSDSGTSNFRIDSKYPTSGGWMSTTNSNGEEYTFGRYPLCYYNNGGWTYSMTNVNNSVPSALLTESLKYFNASFPALNLSANGGTTSTIEMADYNETWLGLTVRYSEHFEIKVNKKTLTSNYGSYESSTTSTRKWISTIVHEMGHILGFVDNASHTPSLYDYRRDREKCLFLQPNDLYALKFFLKNNFGVDITTYGEPEEVKDVATISSYSLIDDVEETDVEFNFDYLYYQDDELEEVSDVIVKCKLKYKSTDTLDVHNDEDSNLYFDYNIYEMETEESIKGELTNNLLKIHISENLEIDENKTYKLYLKQFDNTPCSLVNIKQGVVEL